MITKEVGNIAFLGVAAGLFWYGNTLNDKAEAPAPAAPVAVAAPVVATPPAPQPVVAAVPAAPVAAAQPVVAPAPTPTVAPTPPKPVVKAPVAKPPVQAKPPVVAGPKPLTDNPDDSPGRTRSGKVVASSKTDLPPAYGPRDAKVLVVVFSDFQCPVCRRAGDATHQIAEEFPGEVRLEFWQHALAMHRNAEGAAIASVAAHLQGKFWEYHDLLFRNQAGLDTGSLRGYAEQLGMDMAKYDKDIADPVLKARVKKEGDFADALGARGTPAFMINGKLSVGWGSWNGFRGMVQRELTQANSAKGTPAAVREARAKANITDPEHFQLYLNTALAQRGPGK
ncbi:MAG: protein-disulfide isomerase [Myxococcota bacterium]|jgi:protein-disulfide isomerase